MPPRDMFKIVHLGNGLLDFRLKRLLVVIYYHYRPQRSCGQAYVFTRVCDSLHRGGLPQCMLGYHPREGSTPPGKEAAPRERAHPPRKEAHPPEGSTPRHTVNKRPVRILLECILVLKVSFPHKDNSDTLKRKFP